MTAATESPTLPRLSFSWPEGADFTELLTREWLVTNGRGGYASGTLPGCNTRRYHGLFIPGLEKKGRTVMLARLNEEALVGGQTYRLDTEQGANGSQVTAGARLLRGFHLEGLVPHWLYQLGETRLQRKLTLVHGENTLVVVWEHLSGPEVGLRLRPFPTLRMHDDKLHTTPLEPSVRLSDSRMELRAREGAPPLRLRLYSSAPTPFMELRETSAPLLCAEEKARGYDHVETLVSPGYFECTLRPGERLAMCFTTEDAAVLERDPHETFSLEYERERRLLMQVPPSARTGVSARLVLAADQFIIAPTRSTDEAWARAVGQDVRSVIAGYHWFTDWGRDTMISLEGLTLSTGRHATAAAILRTFHHHVRDGLLPNLFPEGESEGLYHTADATLWFFHAVDRYLQVTKDEQLLRDFHPTLAGIIAHHQKGTRHNIRVDPRDGLLSQGEEGYQLTWMDAKVDGWVVTPRRGKAVELNALWFNALRLMVEWSERLGEDARPYATAAEQAHGSFNRRFWNPDTGCLFDVVDGEGGEDDPSVRPNQVFAISLKNPVLRRDKWEPVMAKVREQLLTPVGLRSLAPGHPDYKPNYEGDLRARDAAYHQGTVWGWLIGHYVDATLKLTEDKRDARAVLEGMKQHLEHAGVGQLSEIFDATEPFHPRGCIAQAWSVAETLRVFLKTDMP
ncbi:glycogen debranching protein [Cystobacter fuscus]|uniref:amylo-alpha-1,6-glucosidase n=1 Tax=Cystobacter fuscus TaxID=43 RepID=UPI002B29B429|nr:glycogen debranching protein [Cystobacter fuscus]